MLPGLQIILNFTDEAGKTITATTHGNIKCCSHEELQTMIDMMEVVVAEYYTRDRLDDLEISSRQRLSREGQDTNE